MRNLVSHLSVLLSQSESFSLGTAAKMRNASSQITDRVHEPLSYTDSDNAEAKELCLLEHIADEISSRDTQTS